MDSTQRVRMWELAQLLRVDDLTPDGRVEFATLVEEAVESWPGTTPTAMAEPLTDEEIAAIRADATDVNRYHKWDPGLSAERYAGWATVRNADVVRLLDEVAQLQELLALTVIHIYDGAIDEIVDHLERHDHGLAWAHEQLGRDDG